MDTPALVHTCMTSLGEAGDEYGLWRMQAEPVGELRTLPDGSQVVQLKVRMTYDRRTGKEVREATIVCTVRPNGRVQVTVPGE